MGLYSVCSHQPTICNVLPHPLPKGHRVHHNKWTSPVFHWLSHTNKCTVIYCTSLKFTLKTFKSSYMFPSSDHLQRAYIVCLPPC
jgi:hypothetical protein